MSRVGKGIYSFDLRLRLGYSITDEHLAVLRIVFALTCLFITGIHDFRQVGEWPASLYSPPLYSLAHFFHDFPEPWFFWIITFILQFLFVALLFGWNTSKVCIAITVLLIISNSFKYSIGKINHDILFVITPLIMAYSGWGNRLSMDERQAKVCGVRFPGLMTLAFLLAIGMATSAFVKFWFGWLDPDTQAVKAFIIRRFHVFNQSELLIESILRIESTLFWEALDYLAVTVEVALLPLFCFPKRFKFGVILLIIFHIGTILIMNLPFALHIPVYLLFLPLGRNKLNLWINAWKRRLIRISPPYFLFLGAMIIVTLQLGGHDHQNFPSIIKITVIHFFKGAELMIPLVAWTMLLMVFLYTSFMRNGRTKVKLFE